MDKTKERETLISLIINAKRTDPETGSFTEWLADFLLDHGVTVPADNVLGTGCLQENHCPAPAFRVGDRAWKANDAYVFEVDVRRLIYDCGRTSFDDDDIGETVFRTKDEAEAAMEKMKEAPHHE